MVIPLSMLKEVVDLIDGRFETELTPNYILFLTTSHKCLRIEDYSDAMPPLFSVVTYSILVTTLPTQDYRNCQM